MRALVYGCRVVKPRSEIQLFVPEGCSNHLLVWIVKTSGCHCTDGHLTGRVFTEDQQIPYRVPTPLRSTCPFSDDLIAISITNITNIDTIITTPITTAINYYCQLLLLLLILSFLRRLHDARGRGHAGQPHHLGRYYLSNATCLMRPRSFSTALLV